MWFFLILAQAIPSIPLATPGAVSGERQQGLYVTAPITVDGATVFRVASLAKPDNSMPLDTRVLLVRNALAQVLATNPDTSTTVYNPQSFQIHIDREGSEYSLVAKDEKHPAPLDIVTVTSNDAYLAGVPDFDLAQQWQASLQPALVAALERRQPANIESNMHAVGWISAILAVLTLIALLVWWRIRHRAVPASAIVLAIVVMWGVAITWALLLFPSTTSLGQHVVEGAIEVAVIAIVALFLDWLGTLIIAQLSQVYVARAPATQRGRHELRAPTVSRAVNGFKRGLIAFVAILVALGQLDIPIASVVTIGGVAALAVGFAAQSIVKDVLGGLLVLLEDQYVVGDYVLIGEYNGLVEHLTLRMLQVRDASGRLITIPHSSVTQVVNASRGWSRIDYRVAVGPGVDADKALGVLRATIENVQKEESWASAILIPIEWMGVETIGQSGSVLRASVRTAPLRQFELRRYINKCVLQAFAAEGIPLGIDPQNAFVPSPTQSADPT